MSRRASSHCDSAEDSSATFSADLGMKFQDKVFTVYIKA